MISNMLITVIVVIKLTTRYANNQNTTDIIFVLGRGRDRSLMQASNLICSFQNSSLSTSICLSFFLMLIFTLCQEEAEL